MSRRLKGINTYLPYIRAVVGVILICLLVIYVDVSKLLSNWAEFNLTSILSAAIFILIATVIGGYNIHLFLDSHESIPFSRFIGGYWIAWAVGLVVPGQVGDIASLSVWLRRHGFQWHLSLGCALLDKLISFIWLGGLGAIGLLYFTLGKHHQFSDGVLNIILGFSILMLLVYLLRGYIAESLGKRSQIIRDTFHTISQTARSHKGKVYVNILLTGVKVALLGFAYWSMFKGIGHDDLKIVEVILLVSASSLIAYIPISFNGMGTVEIAGIVLFGWLGISAADVVSVYLALRILVMLLAWAPAGLLLLFSSHSTDQSLS